MCVYWDQMSKGGVAFVQLHLDSCGHQPSNHPAVVDFAGGGGGGWAQLVQRVHPRGAYVHFVLLVCCKGIAGSRCMCAWGGGQCWWSITQCCWSPFGVRVGVLAACERVDTALWVDVMGMRVDRLRSCDQWKGSGWFWLCFGLWELAGDWQWPDMEEIHARCGGVTKEGCHGDDGWMSIWGGWQVEKWRLDVSQDQLRGSMLTC